MEKQTKKISKKTKVILGLVFFALGLTALCLGLWFGGKILFSENPRFIVRDIQYDCRSGFWAGKNEQEKQDKAMEIARIAGVMPGITNSFTLNLRKMRQQILAAEPEIADISIHRELPDMLAFELTSRIPCADTGRKGFYLASDGSILLQSRCSNLKGSLPLISVPELKKDLIRGQKLKSQDVVMALQMIRLISVSQDPKIQTIKLIRIVKLPNQDYLMCDLTYQNASQIRQVQIPCRTMSDDQFRHDIFGRLIDWLDTKKDPVLSLRFDNMGVSTAPQL